MQTWQITLKIRLSTASNLILQNSTQRRARKRPTPPSGSHLAGGRRALRRTGLAFQRLGSRPHRPDDLGDGKSAASFSAAPQSPRQSATKHAAAETRLDDGCSWWFKKISDVERLGSPSARLARRLVLNDPSSLSVRHLPFGNSRETLS